MSSPERGKKHGERKAEKVGLGHLIQQRAENSAIP